jgi:hypothetical protein
MTAAVEQQLKLAIYIRNLNRFADDPARWK